MIVVSEQPTVATFEAFYVREYRAMVALAAAASGSGLLAEDLVQEALLRAHRNWPKISGYDKPGAWLRRVTINLASTSRARRRTEEQAKVRLAPGRVSTEIELRDDTVWAAVAELAPKQRAAIAVFYLEDRSVAEISDVLRCSVNTAKAHLHQGRAALAARLEDAS